MKPKKGALVYNWLLTLIAIFILGWALIKFNSSNQFETIGAKQLMLFKTYAKAESALFYIDQSAKYSLQQAIYELARQGGSSDISVDETPASEYESYGNPSYGRCGKYYGYIVWYAASGNTNAECFDTDTVKSSFISIFNDKLNMYLDNYPADIPQDNYNYEIKNSMELVGKAINPLEFNILKDETKPAVKAPEKVAVPRSPQSNANFVEFTGQEKLCRKGKKCLLASNAFDLLQKAEENAAEKGTWIEVTDGYRSREEQIAVWEGKTADNYRAAIPDEALRRKYVCYPYGNDVEQRCPHLTGDAVDVFLQGKNKATMTASDYNLLYSIMSSAGWVRYTKEQWHFECCGTKRFEVAKAKGVTEVGEV